MTKKTVKIYKCDTKTKVNRVKMYCNYHKESIGGYRVINSKLVPSDCKVIVVYSDETKNWDDIKVISAKESIDINGDYRYEAI